MQFFYWIVLLIAIGIAVFSIQNSDAPAITIKYIFWELRTSLVYTILGSIGLGILITLLFWVPRAIRASFKWKPPPEETPPSKPSPLQKGSRGARW
jgi:uncharacterized integral membrane protein